METEQKLRRLSLVCLTRVIAFIMGCSANAGLLNNKKRWLGSVIKLVYQQRIQGEFKI